MGRESEPTLDYDRVAGLSERLAVMLDAGVGPGRAWSYLAETESGARSHLASRRVVSAVIEQVARGYSAGVGAQVTLPIVYDGLAAGSRRAWRPLCAAWCIAAESGAPIVGALRSLADALRATSVLQGEIHGGLAQVRSSTTLVLALPGAGLVLSELLGFDTFAVLVGTWAGRACLMLALALVLAARMWTRRLISRASPRVAFPGLSLLLLVLGLRGGWSLDRAVSEVGVVMRRFELDDTADRAVFDSSVELARRAGIPLVDLLAAEIEGVRRGTVASARARIATLSVTALLPLGLCVLPAFVISSVVPVLITLVGSVAPIVT